MFAYGFHLSKYDEKIKNDLIKSKCKIFQCFIDEYDELKQYQPELKPIIHCSFYINLSSPNLHFTYYKLKQEINFCLQHDIKYYVLHIGKCTKKSKLPISECINNMFRVLKKICIKKKLYKNKNFNICLEMLAGEDNDILYNLEDVNKTLFKDKHYYFKNLKVCLDTCHIFASGVYKMENEKDIKIFFDKIEKSIGLNKIGVIHLNNSLHPFNSKKDQHADLNKGYIPFESMIYLFQRFKTLNKEIILELKDYKYNLDLLKNEIKKL